MEPVLSEGKDGLFFIEEGGYERGSGLSVSSRILRKGAFAESAGKNFYWFAPSAAMGI